MKIIEDKELPDKISGIYSVSCKDYEDKEEFGHIRNFKSHQTNKSAVAGHKIEEAKLLKHIQIWVKLFIHKYKLIAINFDIPSEKNLIFEYIKTTTM